MSVFSLDNMIIESQSSRQKQSISDVLSALSDIIESQQDEGKEHKPTPTEFFALLLSTLGTNTQTNHLSEMLEILDGVIPQSSVAIVKLQFRQLSSTVIQIGKTNPDNNKVLRLVLSILGSAMKIQETSDGFWGAIHALQSVNALLAFIDDQRMKIRKTSHDKLAGLLVIHKKSGAKSVRSYVADFCIGIFKSCTRSEYKKSLAVLSLIESIGILLPESQSVELVETALRLQACGQPILTAAVFRMLDSFFQHTGLSLTADQVLSCVRLTLEMRPESADMESNTYFCTALASGLIALHKRSPELSASLLSACTIELADSCDSEFTQIHVAVASALRRIVAQCYDTALIKDAINSKMGRSSSSTSGSPLLLSIAGIESLFQLRYQHSWVYICGSVRSLFDRLNGETSALLLAGIVSKMADLYQAIEEGKISVSPGVQPALGDTLGSAIRSLGIKNFLSLVPLIGPDSPVFIGIDESREWILTLLHFNLKIMPCRLGDFGGTILPIAKACSQAMLNPLQYNLNEPQVKFISRRINQFWSLFPDFCYYGPTDITANINRLAPLVDGAMKDPNYPDIQPYIISGLTYLAKGARDKCPIYKNALTPQIDSPDLIALKAHAQTFLPSILVFLEKVDVSDPRFQSGVLCVAAWTSIAPPPLVAAISKKLLQMLLTSSSTTSAMNGLSSGSTSEDTKEAAVAAGWIAVIQAIIPHLSNPIVLLLYKTIRPLLTVDTSLSLQKRAYHVLDTLLKTHSDVLHTTEPRSNILAAISESLLSCHVSARSMRLRCIGTLMSSMPNEEISAASSTILGEILICQKDANKKCRDSAMDILKMIVKRLPAMDIMTQLCSAIVAETTVMRSSAVIGMCLLLFDRRDEEMLSEWACELAPTIFLLLNEENPEMTRAVLSFIRVCCVVLPLCLIEALLPQLVEAFTLGLGPYKSKFSSRSRAIMRKLVQRLGDDNVRPLIPELDIPLLDHIQRQQRRAERKKSDTKNRDEDKLGRMMGSDSDDSDDSDDDEERQNIIDPRLVSRPRAQRVTNLMGTLPSTLEEMMYDQTPNFASLRGEGKSTISKRKENGALALATASHLNRGTRAIDEDEEYKVIVNRDGRVVIEHRLEEIEESNVTNNEENENKSKRRLDYNEDNNMSSSKQPEPKKQIKELGAEYKSKKAGGDVWKKGMLEPHAFIPLDARLLNKKNHREAVETFGSVIKGGGGKKAPNVNDNRAHIVTGNRNQRKNDAKHGRYKNIGKTKGQIRK